MKRSRGTSLPSTRTASGWKGNSVEMSDLPRREHVSHSGQSVQRRQRAFGYTEEDLKLLLTPMANTGQGTARFHG